MEKLGIPYMGSKRKLASEILYKITNRHKNITDFYDLFGGIGSEGCSAIKMNRKSISIELKESYFKINEANHKAFVEEKNSVLTLF